MKVSVEEARRIARAGARRERRRRARDRAPAGLPADRHRPARRAAAAPRPLQPPRSPVRPGRARPAALESASLFEWAAFIYPIEYLPIVWARDPALRRERRTKDQRWVREFLTTNRAFRRYVLRELERNGPMLSRNFEDRAKEEKRDHRWWGSRMVADAARCTCTARSPSSGAGRRAALGSLQTVGGPRPRPSGSATPTGSGTSGNFATRASGS